MRIVVEPTKPQFEKIAAASSRRSGDDPAVRPESTARPCWTRFDTVARRCERPAGRVPSGSAPPDQV